MKKNIIIKNSIPKSFLKNKKVKNSNHLISSTLNRIFMNIENRKDTFHLLSNKFKFNFEKSYLKKYRKFKRVAIIGMGGSILGAKAIHCFLYHKIKKSFLFFDNLDEVKVRDLIYKKNSKKTLFIIVSKSGNTIETLTNINLLKKIKLNSSNTIIIVENSNNFIRNLASKLKIPIVEHKRYVGGRYSALSEVGMIPASLMGLKLDNFRKNLLDYFKNKKKKLLIDGVSELSKIYLSKDIRSIVFFNYSPQLVDFAYWCQQLVAESLGKQGKGLLPIVSTGPKDHHSLMQLYLDGPKDKMFYILSSKGLYNTKVGDKYLDKKLKFLKNKELNKIVLSQKDALVTVLKKKNIPFREIYIKNFTEEALGELFSYFMLETAMIGKLINVNPFNQPAVEEVKNLTKKFLILNKSSKKNF